MERRNFIKKSVIAGGLSISASFITEQVSAGSKMLTLRY
jgi:hypothetical protein